MTWWSELRERARGLFLTRRADSELDEELRFHLEMDAAARVRAGADERTARRAAERAFGGVDRHREATRDERGVRPLEDFMQDTRYALRALRRNPGFTAAAVLVLALGIGATTAIFSAVNAVVLRPLPFVKPDQLYMLWEENPEKNWYKEVAAPANMLDWKERVRAFQDVAAYTSYSQQLVLSQRGEPQFVESVQVTGNFFSLLGAQPAAGRFFTDAETWATGEQMVIISHRLWTTKLERDPGIVNSTITLNGEPARVVGVAPERFAFPSADVGLWAPMGWAPENRAQVFFRRAHWLRPIARLRDDASHEQANAQLQAVAAQLKTEYPATNRVMGAGMTPLHEFLIGDTRRPLMVLLGAVGLLLLIGCANIGNLLLVKAAGRQREIAVRSALGAGRFRLIRQMMTESLVLSIAGGAAGLLLGVVGARVLMQLQPAGLLGDARLEFEPPVLFFLTGITLLCGLIFGAVPALWTHRASAAPALKEGGRSGSLGRSARFLAGGLVVGEVAIAVLLVVGAGLLMRSFQQLLRVDPGFDPRGVLAVSLNLSDAKYDNQDKVQVFYETLITRAAAIPGVQVVGATDNLPLATSGYTSDFVIDGRPGVFGSEIIHRVVTPEYLRSMSVPLLRGRHFSDSDRTAGTTSAMNRARDPGRRVLIINETTARKHFLGNPIGQRIAFDREPDSTTVWYTVIGVSGNERQRGIAQEAKMEVLHPFSQARSGRMTILLRTAGDPYTPLPAFRRELTALDPNLPVVEVKSVEAVRLDAVARERFTMVLLMIFAGVASFLAIVGVYGVIAQFTRQHTQDIGVRLALGAQPGDVQRLVVGKGATLVGAGITLGLGAALLVTESMRALLFEVKPIDPVTFASVAAVLAMTGILAAWVPARRASRLDPGLALRPD